ncbi:hypothetical protein PENSPDRAFT_694047 [Peniophora sp. CONT]|nr:hypothetical protein PENSPDRAFT_694047 [Peniophora sp. CONT]
MPAKKKKMALLEARGEKEDEDEEGEEGQHDGQCHCGDPTPAPVVTNKGEGKLGTLSAAVGTPTASCTIPVHTQLVRATVPACHPPAQAAQPAVTPIAAAQTAGIKRAKPATAAPPATTQAVHSAAPAALSAQTQQPQRQPLRCDGCGQQAEGKWKWEREGEGDGAGKEKRKQAEVEVGKKIGDGGAAEVAGDGAEKKRKEKILSAEEIENQMLVKADWDSLSEKAQEKIHQYKLLICKIDRCKVLNITSRQSHLGLRLFDMLDIYRIIFNPWNMHSLNHSAAETLALNVLSDGINLDYEHHEFTVWKEDLMSADNLHSTFHVIENVYVPLLVFVDDIVHMTCIAGQHCMLSRITPPTDSTSTEVVADSHQPETLDLIVDIYDQVKLLGGPWDPPETHNLDTVIYLSKNISALFQPEGKQVAVDLAIVAVMSKVKLANITTYLTDKRADEYLKGLKLTNSCNPARVLVDAP